MSGDTVVAALVVYDNRLSISPEPVRVDYRAVVYRLYFGPLGNGNLDPFLKNSGIEPGIFCLAEE